jgi:hypothetical protein
MSTSANPLDNEQNKRTQALQSGDAIRDLLEKLPIPIILKFRERMNQLHIRHLEVVAEILKQKGYIEPTKDRCELVQPPEAQEFNNG